MAGLVLRTLLHQWRVWISLLLFLALANALLVSVGVLVEAAGRLPVREQRIVRNLSTPMYGMASLAVFVITSSAVSLAVQLQRRPFATWKLAGMSSVRIAGVLVSQLIVLGTVGGALGLPLALLVAPRFTGWVLQANAVAAIVDAPASTLVLLSTWALLIGILLLAGLQGAGSILRVPAVDAVLSAEVVRRRPTAFRLALSLVMSAAVLAVAAGMVGTASGDVSSRLGLLVGLAMLLSLLIIPLIALHVSRIAAMFLAAWTWIVPRRWSTAWYLARRGCAFRLDRVGVSLVPLYVAVALANSIYTVFETADSARRAAGLVSAGEHGINHSGVWTILGPTVVLAIAGTATVVVMAARERVHERALLAVGGVSHRSIVGAGVVEAFMYAVTATFLGLLTAAAVSAVEAEAFGRLEEGARPVLAVAPGLAVGAGGFCVLAAALALPAALEHRRAAVDRLPR
ncbi:hypothetical protein BWO91_03535 [Plantibacter flavus]|uniref:FtsX-like permease family protein n=1 Tax=Plantibacter flavus TaxID=150123 RepID=UPI0009C3BE6A|nr:FtsX-like permease family protein [Plantibacter flavus]AQX79180.1 hypothetical protein BWO91_03535 [Plantibacter flavus]